MIPSVLLVDDDHIAIIITKEYIRLTEFAADVYIANDGLDAIDRLEMILSSTESRLPLLVMLDLNMPMMDGWGVLDHWSARNHQKADEVYFVILSSSVDPADQRKARTYPFVLDFLTKPLEMDNLRLLKELDILSKFAI